MINQCVACGCELPEGSHVCKSCFDKASTPQINPFKIELYEHTPKGCMAIALGIIGCVFVSIGFLVVMKVIGVLANLLG